MKFFSGFIAGIALSFALLVGAATTTINTTAPEDTRIIHCFGKYLNLGRDATQPEVKAAIIVWVKGVVFNVEAEEAKAAAVAATTQIAPN